MIFEFQPPQTISWLSFTFYTVFTILIFKNRIEIYIVRGLRGLRGLFSLNENKENGKREHGSVLPLPAFPFSGWIFLTPQPPHTPSRWPRKYAGNIVEHSEGFQSSRAATPRFEADLSQFHAFSRSKGDDHATRNHGTNSVNAFQFPMHFKALASFAGFAATFANIMFFTIF